MKVARGGLGGRISRFSNVSHRLSVQGHDSYNAIDMDISQNQVSEFWDLSKMHSSVQFDMNINQFSKNVHDQRFKKRPSIP